LKQDVYDQLGWDLLLDSSRIQVSVDHGEVTLTGAVYTYKESLQAAEDTAAVHGVAAVHNQLLVGPEGEAEADEEIEQECERRLQKEKAVPIGAVTVAVHDGWLTLGGKVRNYFQRVAATRAVREVDGVRGLVDDIKISSDPVPTDIANRIRVALDRNALLQGSSVSVSNVGKTVYLDGSVGSYRAKLEAEDVAWGAPGVDDVVDRTIVVV
jgi:osmotically-inducible protein OsmY